MSLLFETIKVFDKKAFNLKFHQIRMQKSLKKFLKTEKYFDLEKIINPPDEKFYRCKIIYSSKRIESVSFFPYKPKKIESFKLIESDIVYNYKFLNRSEIDSLFKRRENADEIIIVKNGKITDTSIANIAFFDGNRWITPREPLLKGTMRAKLLENKKIFLEDIYIDELKFMKKLAIMNALIGFRVVENFRVER